MSAPVIRVSVQTEDFDLASEQAGLSSLSGDIGAVVSFTGLCRDERGTLSAMELEHYPGMAEAELTRIAEEATKRWPIVGIVVIHRHGKILPGENIVGVVTASRHRQAAFDAASFMMDFLKTSAPFWKKEHPADGSQGHWVDARESDDEATKRWKKGSST